jgi:hypothetical protein
MDLSRILEDLKAAVGSRQLTAAQALDVLAAEAVAQSIATPAPTPSQVIIRRVHADGGEAEVKIDVNGGDFDAATALARQLVARAVAAGSTGPIGIASTRLR